MTAEIVLMNKSGIALAADSAVTVSAGSSEKKVFNTASKVFTLSKYAPVGIMIYSGADFCGIAWETIIKDYRSKLKDKRFNTLTEYKNDFFKYVLENNNFFSEQQKANNVAKMVIDLIQNLFASGNKISNNKQLKEQLDAQINTLKDLDFIENFSEACIPAIKREYNYFIDALCEKIFSNERVSWAGCKLRCREYIALSLVKNRSLNSYSGIVIAGFGEKEAFPSLEAIKINGFVINKLRIFGSEKRTISDSNPSDIAPFAQTQMMDSVLLGVLPSYNTGLLIEIYTTILNLPKEIINNIKELDDEKKEKYLENHQAASMGLIKDMNAKVQQLQTDRLAPMKEAISVMPKSELASVAEVFVNIAQLEHRLSLSAETVGGPVDVAVISRGDGMIWIKRKHYFESLLNQGFVENYYKKDYIPK